MRRRAHPIIRWTDDAGGGQLQFEFLLFGSQVPNSDRLVINGDDGSVIGSEDPAMWLTRGQISDFLTAQSFPNDDAGSRVIERSIHAGRQ